MKKVTIVNFTHCNDDEPEILAVVEGTSKAKAKDLAVMKRTAKDRLARIVKSEYGDEDLVLEERYKDDDEKDGFTPWFYTGTIQIKTVKVQ